MMKTQITVPAVRLQQVFSGCLLFSHFDSRGGSTLVHRRLPTEAIAAYVDTFSPDGVDVDPEQRMRQSIELMAMEDDFVGVFRTLVFDVPIERDTEMEAKYEGQYYIGVVYVQCETPRGYTKWLQLKTIVAAVCGSDTRPDWPIDEIRSALSLPAGTKVKVQRRNLGEDAFGLRWI